MKRLLIVTEEQSAVDFLRGYIPRLIHEYRPKWLHGREYNITLMPYNGKGTLLKKRSKAYITHVSEIYWYSNIS